MKYCQIGNNRMLKCSFSEPETSAGGQPGFWGIGNGAGGFQMSFGIGAFPFGFFATNFNIADGAGALGSGQVKKISVKLQ